MIEIDGNYLEGGGQIVRTALALSTLTGKPFKVSKIRSGRKKPGLKAQHLHCIKALEKLCNAKTKGAELGSDYLEFVPGILKGKNIEVDIGTAGSVTLFLQAVLFPLLFAEKQTKTTIIGGTNTMWAMPVEYLQNVLLPQVRPFCEEIEVKVLRRGYFPKGGGKIELRIKPKYHKKDFDPFDEFPRHEHPHINLTNQGKLQLIQGISHASNQLATRKVAERQKEAAESLLKKWSVPMSISVEYVDSYSIGSGISLWAKYAEKADVMPNVILGGSALGAPKITAEKVGREAAEDLLKQMKKDITADQHLADNVIPLMALFVPSSIHPSTITNHTKTNIYTCNKFLKTTFNIENNIISSKLS